MVAHWLTISAVATRIGCSFERVQQLADTGRLHAELIGGDHLSISDASVDAYLSAPELATPSGDVLAAADLEDQASEQLANPPAWIPWSGGDHPDDRDAQADYEPRDAGDDQQ